MGKLVVAAIHGPNLNLLGAREPDHYGSASLAAVDEALARLGDEIGVQVTTFQSNHEGLLVDRVQAQVGVAHGILINAGGYTHTSVALRDALLAVGVPFVEVHVSNVHKREAFRQPSLLADRAVGVVTGFGAASYTLGLRGLVAVLRAG